MVSVMAADVDRARYEGQLSRPRHYYYYDCDDDKYDCHYIIFYKRSKV